MKTDTRHSPSRPGFAPMVLPELAPVQINSAYWGLYFKEISYLEVFPLKRLNREFNRPESEPASLGAGSRLTPWPTIPLADEEALIPRHFWADLKQHLSWAAGLGPGGLIAAAGLTESSPPPPQVSRLTETLRHYQAAPAREPATAQQEKDLKLLAVWLLNALERQSLNQALNTASQMEKNLWARLRGESEPPQTLAETRGEPLLPGLAAQILRAWFRLAARLNAPIGTLLISEPAFGEALAVLGPPPVLLAEAGRKNPASTLNRLRSAGLEMFLKDQDLSGEGPPLRIYHWPGPEMETGPKGPTGSRPPLVVVMAAEE